MMFQINDIAGFDKTFLDLPFLLFLGKKGCIFSGIYFKYKVHMVSNDLLQSQCFRSSVCNCQACSNTSKGYTVQVGSSYRACW